MLGLGRHFGCALLACLLQLQLVGLLCRLGPGLEKSQVLVLLLLLLIPSALLPAHKLSRRGPWLAIVRDTI